MLLPRLRVIAAQAVVHGNPEPPLSVLLNRRNTILGQCRLGREFPATQVITVKPVIRTNPELAAIFLGYPAGRSIVQTILPEDTCPTVFFYV